MRPLLLSLSILAGCTETEEPKPATMTAFAGDIQICPLSWVDDPSANVSGSNIRVHASCGSPCGNTGTNCVNLTYSPTPPSGSSAPAVDCEIVTPMFGCRKSGADATGTVAVTGQPGAYWAEGTCTCSEGGVVGRAEFSLPLGTP